MDIKLLGKAVKYNAESNELVLKLDFVSTDKMEQVEELVKTQTRFTFFFNKGGRVNKTYQQLKAYFRLLKLILLRREIYPSAKHIKTLDTHIKRSILQCDILDFDGKQIPIIPSKADLSIEQMNYLLEEVMDTYNITLEGDE